MRGRSYRTDDPVRDAENYYGDLEKDAMELPLCCYCGEPIQQKQAVNINDDWYCDECLRMYFRKRVERE